MGNLGWLRNRYFLLTLLLVMLILFIIPLFSDNNNSSDPTTIIPISQVLHEAASNPSPLQEIQIVNSTDRVLLNYKDGSQKASRREATSIGFARQLVIAGYDFNTGPAITVNEASGTGGILSLLTFLLPMALFIGVMVFMLRRAQGGNNELLQ